MSVSHLSFFSLLLISIGLLTFGLISVNLKSIYHDRQKAKRNSEKFAVWDLLIMEVSQGVMTIVLITINCLQGLKATSGLAHLTSSIIPWFLFLSSLNLYFSRHHLSRLLKREG